MEYLWLALGAVIALGVVGIFSLARSVVGRTVAVLAVLGLLAVIACLVLLIV